MMVKVMCAGETEALEIARELLSTGLIACANIIGPVTSVFHWKGAAETEREFMLLAKTREEHIDSITAKIIQMHSYELPEVSALPITGGSENYLRWVAEETGGNR